jgi:ElaB/YqjD/DUF883 family membrane-anchored ribosome-binding protein
VRRGLSLLNAANALRFARNFCMMARLSCKCQCTRRLRRRAAEEQSGAPRSEGNMNTPTQAMPGAGPSNAGPRPSDLATAKDNAADALKRGKEGLVDAASTLASEASADLESLRRDLNNLKDTVARFMSRAGDVSSSVASQMGSAASNLAEGGANRAKGFAAELEDMGRRNPIGAMGAAVMFGILIGLLSRRRSHD